MEKLRVSALGPVRAWRGGSELDAGTPKQRLVLAALALAGGRPVGKNQLIDVLWDHDPPPTAVNSMRTYISRLRTALGGETIATVGDGYALRDFTSDLAEFEELAAAGRPGEALALWGGEALSGIEGDYAAIQRAMLEERRLVVLGRRIEGDLEAGRHGDLVAELTALHDAYPLHEGVGGMLMLALYRSGRQSEAIAVFTELRRRLDEELGVAPSADSAELYQRIITADPALEAPSRVAFVRVAQLPADIADFTGRDDLVDSLVAALVPGETPVIAAISGIGGVGKTALAVRAAHRVRDRFPDGQLYVDLQGAGPDPMPPHQVLGRFLRAVGGTVSSGGEEELAAAYRSALADRRMLVVLDNAPGRLQLQPLLPGSPGCAVLVTSRARLGGIPGAHVVDLDALDPAEALALFTKIVGAARVAAERPAAAEIVRACGFLPLAVRIAAARLAARPSWSVAVLRDRLADERRRLAELRIGDLDLAANFALSYEQLSDGQARAFRLLAVADAPELTVRQAGLLLDLDERATEQVCEALVDLNLLEAPAPGSYRYHDLVRALALDRTDPAERAPALLRVQDDWLEMVRRNAEAVDGGGAVDQIFTEAACLWRVLQEHDGSGDTVVVARAVAILGATTDLDRFRDDGEVGGLARGLLVLGREAQEMAEGKPPAVQGVALTALRNALAGLGQQGD